MRTICTDIDNLCQIASMHRTVEPHAKLGRIVHPVVLQIGIFLGFNCHLDARTVVLLETETLTLDVVVGSIR